MTSYSWPLLVLNRLLSGYSEYLLCPPLALVTVHSVKYVRDCHKSLSRQGYLSRAHFWKVADGPWC